MNKLPISMLIPTMNRPDSLQRTLNTLLKGDYIPNQIVVVDQSNIEELKERNKKIIEESSLITNCEYYYQEFPSLTLARNKAISLAKNEIVVFSDDDIDVYDCTIKNVYEEMLDDSISMIAGINDNQKVSKSIVGYFLGFKSFSKRHIGHVANSMFGVFPDCYKEQTDTMWAMGFFFVVRKSLLEKWGIQWDEKLISYAYGEDLDFSFSYYKKSAEEGFRCVFSDKVRVKHMCSKEYRVPSTKSTYMYVLNRYYLASKHKMGRKSYRAMWFTNRWIFLMRIFKKENPRDMKSAIKYLKEHKQEVANGVFKYN